VLDMEPLKAVLREYVGFLRQTFSKEDRARTGPLEAEEEKLGVELDKLSTSEKRLKTIMEARVRVLERKADDLIAAGKIEEGQKKGAELEEAKRNLDSLIHREAWIGDRLDQIEREKLNQAKGTINTCFPIFRLFCLSLLRETFLTMDEVWRIYTGFCAEKEISANPMRYREMLKPHVMMDDTETWKRINDWFPQG